MIPVLIADDDMLILGRLNEILAGFEDVRVIAQASNGREALDLIERTKPHIVILDMDMPVLNGVQVAQRISDKALPVKILALSNYDSFDFVKPIMKLGAADYILKHELSPELLRNKIDEMKSGFEKSVKPPSTKREKLSAVIRGLSRTLKNEAADFTETAFAPQIENHALIILYLPEYRDFFPESAESRRERLMQSIRHICETIFNSISNGCIQVTGERELAVLFDFSEIHDYDETVHYTERYLKMITGNLAKILKLEILFAYTIFSGTENRLIQFYQQTRDKLEAKQAIDAKNTDETEYPDPVRRILNLIQTEFGRDISLAEISQLAGLSEPYVSKLFKTAVGVPFIEYLCDFRIIKARSLLKTTDMQIKDISAAVGFRNYNYFINVFRNKTGLSPAEFRKSVLEQHA